MGVTRTSGSSAGITGRQIRDNTVTGDDINELTLKMPHPYHSSGNQSSLSIVYLAIPGRNGWSTSFTKSNHQLIAPFDGMVTKVSLRPTTGDNINSCFFQVRTNGDGFTAANGQGGDLVELTFEMHVGVDRGTTELILDPPVPIAKGRAFSFAILKGASPGYGITDAVMVIEWDLST